MCNKKATQKDMKREREEKWRVGNEHAKKERRVNKRKERRKKWVGERSCFFGVK
jgi:hypothetical protein